MNNFLKSLLLFWMIPVMSYAACPPLYDHQFNTLQGEKIKSIIVQTVRVEESALCVMCWECQCLVEEEVVGGDKLHNNLGMDDMAQIGRWSLAKGTLHISGHGR